MSFVSIFLDPNFLSIVSDGQETYGTENVGNNYQKFFKLNSKLIVTGTGHKDVLDRMKLILLQNQIVDNISAKEVSEKLKEAVFKSLEGVVDNEGNKVNSVLAVCGVNENNNIFFSGYKRSDDELTETNYEIISDADKKLVTLNPPDLSFNAQSAFQSLVNRGKPRTIKQIQKTQKDLQRMVARTSVSVNNVSFEDKILKL
ncbi:hypothetical protein MXF01_03060 [Enterococcus casseliflavus]|uniref:hypothetical protein n=1 Tax=Enterococcus casseliflavus TaxID=37734 RepID=UPI002DB87570|nr:hypothetical protein [Enterococcus casseliflavus]MEB6179682.1 hypothetical protein [Enterococcus casseliflavus]